MSCSGSIQKIIFVYIKESVVFVNAIQCICSRLERVSTKQVQGCIAGRFVVDLVIRDKETKVVGFLQALNRFSDTKVWRKDEISLSSCKPSKEEKGQL